MRTKTKQNSSYQNLALEQVSIPVGKETATILGSTDAALILQQLHFWLSLPGVGRVVSGIKWIYNTYKQWLQELPWLKETQWRKAMRHLRNLGIVKFAQLDAREWKQRGWYSIDYQRLKALIPSIRANSPNQSDESQLIDSSKSNESSISTEKTNRDSLSESSAPANAAPEPHPGVCENSLEKTFQEELSKHLGKNEVDKQLAQENENFGEDNYSAATPQIEAKYSMTLNEVEHVKPKLKSDSLSGFYSQEERDNFYQVLLELAKHKSGVRSIVGWANAIIKSINASEPCEYLNEFRRGELVGTCEKHEWEIAPGKPYPQLLTYLKRRLKTNLISDDQAIATAYQELSDVNRATAHWESFKRTITNTKADWDKQQALGVSSAYIPPELLPEREVSVEEAVSAMHELQANCIHPGLAPSVPDLSSSVPMSLPLEPTEDKALPAVELEPELPTEPIAPPLHDLQEKLNHRNTLMISTARFLIGANPQWGYVLDEELNLVLPVEGPPPVEHLQWLLNNTLTANKVRHLLERNPNWGFLIDRDGQVWNF